jgi:flagellar transcriptional activator FlhC
MATKRDLSGEIARYQQARRLFEHGARVPVVFEMTRLSSWFLRKLSREISGVGPRKGQMPNSDAWYVRSRNNLQVSLFMAHYRAIKDSLRDSGDACDLLISAYEQYLRVVHSAQLRPVLGIDRAWWLLKSMQIRNLKLVACVTCGGDYVAYYGDLAKGYVCASCAGYCGIAGSAPHQVRHYNARASEVNGSLV